MSFFVNAPHGWLYWVLLAVAVVAAAWFYRRVPPSVDRRLRALLGALRAAALALLVLALMEPVLAFTRSLNERPVVVVLFDASRSMAMADGSGGASRADQGLSAVNDVVLPRLAKDADVVAYSFSSDTGELEVAGRALAAGPLPEGGVTDIAQALSSVRDEMTGRNLGAVVLVTDGANNRGGSPGEAATALGAPVYAVGVGSTEPKTDIAVREIVTNRISYVGEALPVAVRIVGQGFGDSQTVATLSEDGAPVDTKTVSLSGTGEETVVTFRVVPSTPGVHRYTVSVPAARGELTTANNTRVAVTNALKAKIRVLLVGARPSWDYAFLLREFERDRNADLTAVAIKEGAVTGRATGLPQSRDDLLAYDLAVLVEPDWSASPVRADWLASFVRDRGGGLLVVGLPESPAAPSADLLSVLPLSAGRRAAVTPRESRVALTDLGEAVPTMRVATDRFENAEAWRALPPIWAASNPWWGVRPEADVLAATADAGSEAPLVVAWRAGAGHVMAIPAEGLWRWKMAERGEADLYGRFVANAVRWLTARGDLEPLSVSTDRDVYAAGEPVSFSAQVYGEELRPVTDASVSVSVSTGEGAAPVATVALAPGGDEYRAEAGPFAPGRYVYEAVAVRRGEEVGRARGEVTVEEYSLEDSEVRQRPALLMEIAEATGGLYLASESVSSFPEDLALAPREITRKHEVEVWNSPWLLVGFVGLLSAEWAIRRMKGLA